MQNPFYYGPHLDPDRFVGRRAELTKLFSALEVVHTGQLQSISVVGPRRIGKSSLLFYAFSNFSPYLQDTRNYRFAYVSLFDAECKTLNGLLGRILGGLHLNRGQGQMSLVQFQNDLRAFKATGGLAVILLDEFEKLIEKPDEFTTDLYDMWRDLIDAGNAAFVTASSVSLTQLAETKRYTSPFFNIFTILPLGEFQADEAEELVRVGANCDRPFNLVEQRQMRELGGRHPYKLQLAGSLIYQSKNDSAEKSSRIQNPQRFEGLRRDFDAQLVQAGLVQKSNSPTRPNLALAILSIPKMMGRALLDLLGNNNPADSSQWIVGFILILLIVAVLLGFIKLEVLQGWLGALTGAGR